MSSTSEVESYNKREKKTVSWYDQNDQIVVEDVEKVVVDELDDKNVISSHQNVSKQEKSVETQVRRVRQSFDLYFLYNVLFLFFNWQQKIHDYRKQLFLYFSFDIISLFLYSFCNYSYSICFQDAKELKKELHT